MKLYFILKVVFLCFIFIFIRSNLPRYRYDQLMAINWKIFLPLGLAYFMFISSFFFGFDGLPFNQLVFSNQSNIFYNYI